MTDAIQVLKPGWRALDANADVYSGAVLHFFDAGTSNTRTVYSNYGLSTALGTTVTCDSGGFPTSDGNSKVEIYTGATPYKVTLKNSAGTTIWTLDNIVAALDTSSFLTDGDIAPDFPVTNSSSNQSLVAADQGKFYNLNCSGGDITVTLAAASVLGNGWNVEIRHDGTANQILVIGTGGELFKIAGRAGVAAFAIGHRGQSVSIKCDGTGFHVQESSPDLLDTNGVILIADRLSAPPSAEAGARYIVGSAPSGAWSTFAEHDIAEANGQGGWFNITPPTNSGWIAYVQDEARHYFHYTSGWTLQVNKQAGEFFHSSGTISAASNLDITIPSDADSLIIELNDIIPGTDNQILWMRFSQSAAFLSGASDYAWSHAATANATNVGTADLADTEIELCPGIGSSTNEGLTLTITIRKPNASSTRKLASWIGGAILADGNPYCLNGFGQMIANTNAIDGVRFVMASGTIASGTYAVRALRYS